MQVADLVSAILGSRPEEAEPEFLREVRVLSRQGLSVIGLLGLIGTVFYVGTHLFILGYTMGWSYEAAAEGEKVLVMWDKLVLGLVSLTGVLAARTEAGLSHGRLILAVGVLTASGAMIVDQVLGGQSVFFVGYLTLLVFAAIGGVPFRPNHAAFVCLIILAMMIVIPNLAGAQSPVDIKIDAGRQATYWLVCSAVLVGIAHLVYQSRLAEFRHRREIEVAEVQIREHAEELERSTAALEDEQRRTQEQAEKLREMEKLKSRFFAGISHEFRTPITLILGPSKDVLDTHGADMDPEIKQALALIQRSGHRLHDLVDQLLDLTRLEAGRLPLHAARQDTAGFVSGVVSVYEPIASSRNIEMVFENMLDDAETWFDSEHMFKVFSNLLSNALKFTKDGGHIRIRVEAGVLPDADAIAISVKDNGVGIPSDQLSLIFDRFHQIEVDGASTGTGIGLALVRELVELHGGKVTVESEPGFGSTFTVQLRRGSDFLIEQGCEVLTQQPPHLETVVYHDETIADEPPETEDKSDVPTILIVEDNDDMRRYLRGALSDTYRVLEAADGREGLRIAATELPALVLTDVMMPQMNGLALCAALKENEETSHIPVVILTARASHEAVIEGLSTGADDYITKPFDAAELVVRTENLIEIRNRLLKRPVVWAPSPSEVDEPSADEAFVTKVSDQVEQHLGDPNFTVDWLADEIGLGRRQLERRLRKITRLTPAGFIRMMRLKRAAQLLEKKVGTVSEVSYRVGFSDPNYFSRLFRQTFKVPPSEYPED